MSITIPIKTNYMRFLFTAKTDNLTNVLIYRKNCKTEKSAFAGKFVMEFILAFSGILFIAFFLFLLSSVSGYFQDIIPAPQINPARIPVFFLVCICSAYFEEYLFRRYIPKKLTEFGVTETTSIAVSTALFGYFHAWEGILGVYNSILSALFLAFCYRRHGNIHIISLAHAVYNIFAYIMAFNSLK
jgi:membrane protease YdiL (CAAX protease family)